MADQTPQDDELDLTDDELDADPAGQPTDDDSDAAGGADEDDADADDEPADDEPQDAAAGGGEVRQPASRSGRQIAALRADRRKQADELAAMRRELQELRNARQQQPPIQQEDPRVEAERLALMSPEERTEYRVAKALQENQRQTNAMVFNMQASQDKTSWDTRAAGDKLRQKLTADVEREYAACIARGQYLPRENIYIYLVGQRFLSNRGKGSKDSRQRVERERTRPAAARGDVAVERRTSRGSGGTSDFERRFGDIPI